MGFLLQDICRWQNASAQVAILIIMCLLLLLPPVQSARGTLQKIQVCVRLGRGGVKMEEDEGGAMNLTECIAVQGKRGFYCSACFLFCVLLSISAHHALSDAPLGARRSSWSKNNRPHCFILPRARCPLSSGKLAFPETRDYLLKILYFLRSPP